MINALIVEDDPLIAEEHRTYLARLEGFSVSGVAATTRATSRGSHQRATTSDSPVDLVLLDLGLPISGAERWAAFGVDCTPSKAKRNFLTCEFAEAGSV
jgi:DNA-binding response OmpR family regulator